MRVAGDRKAHPGVDGIVLPFVSLLLVIRETTVIKTDAQNVLGAVRKEIPSPFAGRVLS